MVKKRLTNVSIGLALVLTLGIGYAGVCLYTPWRLPCLFYKQTGLLCPGCGVTHMCLALLHLDVSSAWQANCVLLLCLPLLAIFAVERLWHYVVTGNTNLRKWEQGLLWLLVAILLFWGTIRNR